MSNNYKEVYFERYCRTCKNYKLKETEDPCNECLNTGAVEHSHKPVKYVKAGRQKKG